MLRRFTIIGIALAAMLVCTLVDCRSADAQGLFRRLRSRIQSRAQPVDPPQQPNQVSPPGQASGATRTPGVQGAPRAPSVGNSSSYQNPQSRVQTRRVSPVSPQSPTAAPTPAPAVRPTRPVAPRPSVAPRPQVAPRAPATTSSVDPGRFGGSILSPAGAAPARSDAGTDTVATARAKRPSLGIQVLEVNRGTPGLEVTDINPGSLADEAGLQKGDVIIMINGQATPTVGAIASHLSQLAAGDEVRARIVRGRSTRALLIPLGPTVASAKPNVSEPIAAASADQSVGQVDFGVSVDESRGVRGVVVNDVAAPSPASIAGILSGDRIVSIDGRLVTNQEVFNRELSKRTVGDDFKLQLVRDGSLIATDVRLLDPKDLAAAEATSRPAAEGTPQDGSVLQGLGNVLGGLLGGQPNAEPAAAKKADEMELDDDEPVRQVDFESDVADPPELKPRELEPRELEPQKLKPQEIQRDPPSLETLELPADQPEPIELIPPQQTRDTESAEKLRAEIQRLQERLKALEAKDE